jgi:SAM-dependent methyltransferase
MGEFGEWLLGRLSRDPGAADYAGATDTYTLDNALDFACRTVPGFLDRIRGKRVLDYGCGDGWQAVAMIRHGAREVVAVDIRAEQLDATMARARQCGCAGRVRAGKAVPRDLAGSLDVAVSLNSLEHFGEPEHDLAMMRAAMRPGGQVIVSFSECWFNHNGSHMGFFTRVPWVNVWFSEATVMKVRSRYRDDGARRYADVPGGLNRMTLMRFERIVRESGMSVELLKFYSTRNLPLVARIPIVREFLVSAAACVLRT